MIGLSKRKKICLIPYFELKYYLKKNDMIRSIIFVQIGVDNKICIFIDI